MPFTRFPATCGTIDFWFSNRSGDRNCGHPHGAETCGSVLLPGVPRKSSSILTFIRSRAKMTRMAIKDQIMEVIGGPHVTAVATVDGKRPAVRFMVLAGFPDMTFVGATMKASKKVQELKKNADVALSTWSGKEFSDPYVEVIGKGKIFEDVATKKKYWNPMFEQYFKTPENPDFVVLVFTASEITYHGKNMATMEVWKR
jgi:general stress protein 26